MKPRARNSLTLRSHSTITQDVAVAEADVDVVGEVEWAHQATAATTDRPAARSAVVEEAVVSVVAAGVANAVEDARSQPPIQRTKTTSQV